jgi:hypothetical protein
MLPDARYVTVEDAAKQIHAHSSGFSGAEAQAHIDSHLR